jgi:AAA+ ATPase superfamily predicted ATPase
MTAPFLNRHDEQKRLRRAMTAPGGTMAVVYGRRRCGKSTLLQQVISGRDVYYLADQQEPALQIHDLASEIDKAVPHFSTAGYATWDSLLLNLNDRLDRPIALCLDEFPYLVQQSPALPSILQKYIDRPGSKRVNLVLCGSSQRMMHGLVLDRTAPLYGRATEILRIEPLKAGWIREALSVEGQQAIEAYSVWGGVPRYWELASGFDTLKDAVRELVLDRNGVLHEEPLGLLLDEMRSAVQPLSLLTVIAQGSHRLSEIAARLGKPATSLTRPLAQLIDLGYVRRETPFGEHERNTRKTLYKVSDPFILFHFKLVQPARSLLEIGAVPLVAARIDERFPHHVSTVWEAMARAVVPFCKVGGYEWGPARRWWGTGIDGRPMEIDLVAESLDGKAVLVGEAKWTDSLGDPGEHRDRLLSMARNSHWARGREVVPALWAKQREPSGLLPIQTPDDVLTLSM